MNHAFICGGEILNPSEVKKKKIEILFKMKYARIM